MQSNFDYLLDFLVVIPILLAARAVWPNPAFFRLCAASCGIYLLFIFFPRFGLLIVLYWVAIWSVQYLASAARLRNRSYLLVLALLVALGPMLLWKFFPVAFQNKVNEYGIDILYYGLPFAMNADSIKEVAAPLGLSFFTFRAVDLLVKIYLELLSPISFGRLLYYGFFPPILSLGPIAEYEEVRCEAVRRFPRSGDVAVGIFRIAFGAAKIFMLAIACQTASDWLWDQGNGALWAKWLSVLAYGMFFYLNFSGYSEVAIGSSRLLGIRLKENFANPYMKTNPQAFWSAWHMSLTRFAQRYVFVPLGGMRQNRQYFAIVATIMVIAFWHGISLPILLFGIIHSSAMVAHRWLTDRRRRLGLPAVADTTATLWLKRFGIFTFVSVTIPLLLLESMAAAKFYAALIGL